MKLRSETQYRLGCSPWWASKPISYLNLNNDFWDFETVRFCVFWKVLKGAWRSSRQQLCTQRLDLFWWEHEIFERCGSNILSLDLLDSTIRREMYVNKCFCLGRSVSWVILFTRNFHGLSEAQRSTLNMKTTRFVAWLLKPWVQTADASYTYMTWTEDRERDETSTSCTSSKNTFFHHHQENKRFWIILSLLKILSWRSQTHKRQKVS